MKATQQCHVNILVIEMLKYTCAVHGNTAYTSVGVLCNMWQITESLTALANWCYTQTLSFITLDNKCSVNPQEPESAVNNECFSLTVCPNQAHFMISRTLVWRWRFDASRARPGAVFKTHALGNTLRLKNPLKTPIPQPSVLRRLHDNQRKLESFWTRFHSISDLFYTF